MKVYTVTEMSDCECSGKVDVIPWALVFPSEAAARAKIVAVHAQMQQDEVDYADGDGENGPREDAFLIPPLEWDDTNELLPVTARVVWDGSFDKIEWVITEAELAS